MSSTTTKFAIEGIRSRKSYPSWKIGDRRFSFRRKALFLKTRRRWPGSETQKIIGQSSRSLKK